MMKLLHRQEPLSFRQRLSFSINPRLHVQVGHWVVEFNIRSWRGCSSYGGALIVHFWTHF